VRKAIILVSDGEDNQSRVYDAEAIKECERAETIIYAISTNWTPSRGEGDKVLRNSRGDRRRALLPALGGRNGRKLQRHRRRAAQPVRAVYTPADFKADGSFRTIYLYCFDRRYQVRAKKGYFAPRQ
jgi:Ca-activated chloride channel homolog